ncbi:MAG TPA: hypothetical protein VNI84_18065 [Pyrinomonadaceae bacterium]|nr:hypothetical protein [Pyrinomonadaceae bacterium]
MEFPAKKNAVLNHIFTIARNTFREAVLGLPTLQTFIAGGMPAPRAENRLFNVDSPSFILMSIPKCV